MVGEEIYKAMIKVDGECFAYFAYKSPEDIVDPEDLKIIRDSYANVLRTVEEQSVRHQDFLSPRRTPELMLILFPFMLDQSPCRFPTMQQPTKF